MRNYISPIIAEKKPNFLKTEFRKFGRFIDHFFQFLEEQGNPLELLENFYDNFEANNEIDVYIDKLLFDCGFDINRSITIPKKELILHLRDFYLSRGSEASFSFLFRLLYNSDIEIDYPRTKMLVPSQATYSRDSYIFTTATSLGTKKFDKIISLANSFDLVIEGVSSKTKCSIENILFIYDSNSITYLKIQIDSPFVEFLNGEGVKISSQSTNIHIFETFISTIDFEIKNPGHLYQVGDTINVDNVKIHGIAKVKSIKDGYIDEIEIVDGGLGYAIGDQVIANTSAYGHSFSGAVTEIDRSKNALLVANQTDIGPNDDYTIEFWVYKESNKIVTIISNSTPAQTEGFRIEIDFKNKVIMTFFDDTSSQKIYQIFTAYSMYNNVWNHIAVCKDSNILRIFINGKMSLYYDNWLPTIGSSEPYLKVGVNENYDAQFEGYIGELRITKGARYTTDFAVPTDLFNETDQYFNLVKLLIHFNDIDNPLDFEDSSNNNLAIVNAGSIVVTNKKKLFNQPCGFFNDLGAIKKINIYNKGYNYREVPELKVISRTGKNAIIRASSKNIGNIESLEILSPFVNSYDTNNATIITKNGQGAEIEVKSKSVFNAPYIWSSYEGTLGLNSILLDSLYYQQLSYSVMSSIPKNEYEDIMNEWLHPFGFIRFSILDIYYSEKMNLKLEKLDDDNNDIIDKNNLIIIYEAPSNYMFNSSYNLNFYKDLDEDIFDYPIYNFDNYNETLIYNRMIYMNQTIDAQIDSTIL